MADVMRQISRMISGNINTSAMPLKATADFVFLGGYSFF